MAHTDGVNFWTAALIAHQGGWDEILLVAAPIAVFAALLFVANRRAGQQQGDVGSEPKSVKSAKATKEQKVAKAGNKSGTESGTSGD